MAHQGESFMAIALQLPSTRLYGLKDNLHEDASVPGRCPNNCGLTGGLPHRWSEAAWGNTLTGWGRRASIWPWQNKPAASNLATGMRRPFRSGRGCWP